MKDNATKIIAVLATVTAIVLGVVLITQGDDDDDDAVEIGTPAAQVDTQDDAVADATTVEPDDAQAAQAESVVDADDQPISQGDAKKVTAAALDIAGGGSVTDLDRSDDPGEAWEVEVTFDDGTEMDIALDDNLARVQNTSYDD